MDRGPFERRTLSRLVFGFMTAALIFGLGSVGAEAAKAPKSKAKKKATVASEKVSSVPAEPCPPEEPAAPGMRAFIDPATGALREPTAEEAAELSRPGASRRALAPRPVQEIQLPDGSVAAEVGEELMNEVTVQKKSDGTLSIECAPKDKAKKPAAPAKAGELETR